MQYMWPFIEIAATGIEIAYLMHILANKMGLQKWVKPILLIFVWTSITTIITMFNYLTNNSSVSVYLYPVLFSVYIFGFLEGKIKNRIFWFLFPLAILCCFSISCMTIFTYILGSDFYDYAVQDTLRLIIILVDKSLLILFWVLLIRLPKIDYFKTKMLYLLVPMLSVLILSVIVLTRHVIGINNSLLFLIITFLLIFVNASYFIFHRTNEKQNKLLLEKSLQLQNIELQYKYYQQMDEFFENLKRIRQEINEHLQVIWLLSRSPKIKDFERYSIQIHGINEQLGSMNITGNNIIDAIIWNRKAIAQKNNINFIFDIELDNEYYISSDDLCFVLDNSLEIIFQFVIKSEGKTLYLNTRVKDKYFEIMISTTPGDSLIFEGFEEFKNDKMILKRIQDKDLMKRLITIFDIISRNLGLLFYKSNVAIFIKIPFKNDTNINAMAAKG